MIDAFFHLRTHEVPREHARISIYNTAYHNERYPSPSSQLYKIDKTPPQCNAMPETQCLLPPHASPKSSSPHLNRSPQQPTQLHSFLPLALRLRFNPLILTIGIGIRFALIVRFTFGIAFVVVIVA